MTYFQCGHSCFSESSWRIRLADKLNRIKVYRNTNIETHQPEDTIYPNYQAPLVY